MPAGEARPALEDVRDAARQEALALERDRGVSSRGLPIKHKAPNLLYLGPANRISKNFPKYLEQKNVSVKEVASYRDVLEEFDDKEYDILIVDSQLKESNAVESFRKVRRKHKSLYVVLFMEELDGNGIAQVFREGAADVLIEPVKLDSFTACMDRILKRREETGEQESYRKNLENISSERTGTLIGYMEALKHRTSELSLAYDAVIDRLCRAAQWRDDETGDHIARIGIFSGEVARRMGLPTADVELLKKAAPLHDIGKIGVPDRILLKPGRLTPFEYEYMKTHTLIGAEILSGSNDPLLRASEGIALTHHEWYNGGGYPNALSRDQIPLFGSIVAVVDVYDALTHERSYKRAVPLDQTIDMMSRRRGSHFHPDVFDVFLESVETLVRMEKKLASTHSSDTKYSIKFGLHSMTEHLEQTWVPRNNSTN